MAGDVYRPCYAGISMLYEICLHTYAMRDMAAYMHCHICRYIIIYPHIHALCHIIFIHVYQSLYMMLRCLSILTMASETPASYLYVEYSAKPPNLPTEREREREREILTLVKNLQ
jgi:hypothetical protein